jgi:2-methylcitrate dehydratase PrpD
MEFLAEGAWTKRIHPGWAGQSGLRAALLARSGFTGPRAVLEGKNGFFRAFAKTAEPQLASVTADLGSAWRMDDIAFKVYPCGTMIGPYIDCAIMLRERGVPPEDIVRIRCKVAAGVAARQWEPLAEKRRPSNEFSAKFSGPFGVALGLVYGEAGLGQYTEASVRDPALLDVTGKIEFEIDPANPFPERYTGDLEAELRDGTVLTFHQPHLRGGRAAPPSREDLLLKFQDNIRYGGWSDAQGAELAAFCAGAFEAPDLSGLKAFRI